MFLHTYRRKSGDQAAFSTGSGSRTRATFRSLTTPMALNSFKVIQEMSNSYQASPWRAETGCAWWLLCHPSPKVTIATHQLLVESSLVTKRRLPHMWVAEFTSQVACRPTVTRKKMPHITKGKPPTRSRTMPSVVRGTQCHLVSHTWNLSRRRSGV